MADYAEALADYDLVDATLRRAGQPGYLPAVQPAPVVVHQPAPVQPGPRVDVLSVRLLAGGGSIALAGLGVDLAGDGVRVAGPYLWALAGVMAGLAAVIALLKSKTGGSSTGTQIHISGGRNKFRDVR